MPLRRIAGKRTAYIQVIITSDQATSVTTGARIGLCIAILPLLEVGDWRLGGRVSKSAQPVETAREMASDLAPAGGIADEIGLACSRRGGDCGAARSGPLADARHWKGARRLVRCRPERLHRLCRRRGRRVR